MRLTEKTVKYMGAVKKGSGLTLNQEAIVENYDRATLVANDLLFSFGYLTKAMDDVRGVIKIMKGIEYPQRDIDVFEDILTGLNSAAIRLGQWQRGDVGSSLEELENHWELPEGTLQEGVTW